MFFPQLLTCLGHSLGNSFKEAFLVTYLFLGDYKDQVCFLHLFILQDSYLDGVRWSKKVKGMKK